MTSARPAELCRITVFGPAGRADLAVPITIPVAALLPALLRHTADPNQADPNQTDPNQHPVAGSDPVGDPSWALQRLGEPPLDPQGTPESLDWLDGETLYLRPAASPLPELAFDDIADGMATAVGRHDDRWRPEFGRWLFLTLAAGALATMAMLVFGLGATAGTSLAMAYVLGAALLVASIVLGGTIDDRALILVLGVSGCAFIGLAGAATGVAAFGLRPGSVALGGLTLAIAAAAVLGSRALLAPAVPVVPFGVLLAVGLTAFVAMRVFLDLGLTPASAAGIYCVVALAVLIVVPRLVIRMARLRGPQLPRTAEDLQNDIEPLDAELIIDRTRNADRYLTISVVTASLVFVAAYPSLYGAPGWAPTALAVLVAVSALVRSGGFRGAWQRVSLVVAGVTGLVLPVATFGDSMSLYWRVVALVMLACVVVSLLLAALRPPTRRLVPVWPHRANIIESLVAVAVVPVLLQILGVYAWARGLGG